jgi:hypothetical protein
MGSSPGYFEIFKLSTETGGGGMGIELQFGASDSQIRLDSLASPFPLALSGVDTTGGQTIGDPAFLVGLYSTQVSACVVDIDNVVIDAN